MPLTFLDIERQKNWRIGVFFLLLMAIYMLAIALVAAPFLPLGSGSRFWAFTFFAALLVAGTHFFFSAYDAVSSLAGSLNAQPPDSQDDLHRMLMNVMDELHVATGNKRKIRCLVVPSLSMNALAAADLKGDAVIGITEGLLSRISRPQLEAVVAHEAHHVLSGDCLETTIAASIFGIMNTALERLHGFSRGRTFFSPALLASWLLLKLSYLLNLFISREREYRADAASVRMTRNPIALAETLHLLSRSWRGAGFIGSGLEALCIVNPQAAARDESEGFWADLLSTHPPIAKRMDILLAMARVGKAELDARAAVKAADKAPERESGAYYALSPQNNWQGPFSMNEINTLPWLSPLTWIMKEGERSATRAWKDPAVNALFPPRLLGTEQLSAFACPACHQPLLVESYEGTQIHQCRFCAGILVENSRIPRIIARTGREQRCSARINALARAVVTENQRAHWRRRTMGRDVNVPLLACPRCGNPMYRGFYSLAHLVEIDRCGFCAFTWFDQDELAMLQCLIENRIMPDTGSVALPGGRVPE